MSERGRACSYEMSGHSRSQTLAQHLWKFFFVAMVMAYQLEYGDPRYVVHGVVKLDQRRCNTVPVSKAGCCFRPSHVLCRICFAVKLHDMLFGTKEDSLEGWPVERIGGSSPAGRRAIVPMRRGPWLGLWSVRWVAHVANKRYWTIGADFLLFAHFSEIDCFTRMHYLIFCL
jgi:hypothetical protein